MPSISRLDSLVACWRSCSISSNATAHAFPSPTTSGVGSVPERSPRSWPPPLMSGSILTRGRRRT